MSAKQCVYTVSHSKTPILDTSGSVSNFCHRCQHDDVLLRSDTDHRSDIGSRSSANHRPNSRAVSSQNSHRTPRNYAYPDKRSRLGSCDVSRSDRSRDSIGDPKHLGVDLYPHGLGGLVDVREAESGYDVSLVAPGKHDLLSEDDRSVSSAHKQVNGVISKTLLALCLICVACLALALLALQLIVSLSQPQPRLHSSLLHTSDQLADVLEVAVAVVTLVVTLDLGCLVVCSMQCFYVAKIMQLPDGDYRSIIYLKQCAGTRFLAVFAFFASIPVFFLAVVLYIVMRFSVTPAVISIVILAAGMLLCVGTSVHSTYLWRVAKHHSDNFGISDATKARRDMKLYALNQFSTLV